MFRSIRVLSKVARAGGISGGGGRAAGHTSLCPKAPLLPDEDECFITELLDGRNTPTASCPATQAGIDMSDRWKTMLRREHQRSMSMEARAVPNSRARSAKPTSSPRDPFLREMPTKTNAHAKMAGS
jgi:hypothetical protein